MRVLFVCSGNSGDGISPIIRNQANSLISEGIRVDVYAIQKKGVIGYLRTVPELHQFFKKNKYDVIHAHYSKSAYVATLAGAKPLVTSLMGTDVYSSLIDRLLIKFFSRILKVTYRENVKKRNCRPSIRNHW